MSPRVSLPGADELFRTTSVPAAPGRAEQPTGSETREGGDPHPSSAPDEPDEPPARAVRRTTRRSSADRTTSGRERHDEKITVYVSAGELVDLEHARLALRAEHGIAVDRGRIVREALAVVLADLEAKHGDSILVRRLGGR